MLFKVIEFTIEKQHSTIPAKYEVKLTVEEDGIVPYKGDIISPENGSLWIVTWSEERYALIENIGKADLTGLNGLWRAKKHASFST